MTGGVREGPARVLRHDEGVPQGREGQRQGARHRECGGDPTGHQAHRGHGEGPFVHLWMCVCVDTILLLMPLPALHFQTNRTSRLTTGDRNHKQPQEWPADLVILAMGFLNPEATIPKGLGLEVDQVRR